MGLDMYLERDTYAKNWDFYKPEERWGISVKRGGKKYPHLDVSRISGITEQVMYWRKANAIHQWFVNNCQDGEDNCQRSYVSVDNLHGLLETCKKVKADPSLVQELLPPQSGFFFGSTEVDEWYWRDIDATIAFLEEELGKGEEYLKSATYYYQASW